MQEYTQKNKYILVADHDETVDYGSGRVIAMTPWAAYDLTRAGVRYGVLQDHYSVDDCIKDQDRYFLDQVEWVEKVDVFLKEKIPFLDRENIDLFMPHFSRIKYLVDTIIMRSYMIREFLERAEPSSVLYVSRKEKPSNDHSIYSFRNRALSILKDITLAACAEKGIPIEVCHKQYGELERTAKNEDIKSAIKKAIPVGPIRSVRNILNYNKIPGISLLPGICSDMKVLVLDAGNKPIDHLIRDLIRNGAKVFLRYEDGIYLISGLFEKFKVSPRNMSDKGFVSDIKKDLKNAFIDMIERTDLLDWVIVRSGLDITSIMCPYLEHFFAETALKFIIDAKNIKDFYIKEEIDMVIGRASVGENCAPALAAAVSAGNVKRVCFQHSCSVLDLKDWSLDDLRFFDYYFSMDDLSQGYFEHCSKYDHIHGCEVLQSPHYLKDIIGSRKKKTQDLRVKREKVVYITKKLTGGMLRYNTFVYPITWYFNFQKRIVDLFGKRTDFDFVFKHSPAQKWAERSIHKYLEEGSYPNIVIEDRPFLDYLDEADRIIMDYPSTGFFEAAAAGVPVMSFYWDKFREWGPSVDYFGKCLARFSSEEEAIKSINSFLDDDPREYIKELPYTDNGIAGQLYRIKNEFKEEIE